MTTPFSSPPPPATWGAPFDPNETLRRIDQNLNNLLWWVKVLVAVVVISFVLLALGI